MPREYLLILYLRKRRFVARTLGVRYGQLVQEKASTGIVTYVIISLFPPSPFLRQARVQDNNLRLEHRKDQYLHYILRLAFSSTEIYDRGSHGRRALC